MRMHTTTKQAGKSIFMPMDNTYAALGRPNKNTAILAVVDLNLRCKVADVNVAILTILDNEHLAINLSRLFDTNLHPTSTSQYENTKRKECHWCACTRCVVVSCLLRTIVLTHD